MDKRKEKEIKLGESGFIDEFMIKEAREESIAFDLRDD